MCAFVFAYAKGRFSHDAAHLFLCFQGEAQKIERLMEVRTSYLKVLKFSDARKPCL